MIATRMVFAAPLSNPDQAEAQGPAGVCGYVAGARPDDEPERCAGIDGCRSAVAAWRLRPSRRRSSAFGRRQRSAAAITAIHRCQPRLTRGRRTRAVASLRAKRPEIADGKKRIGDRPRVQPVSLGVSTIDRKIMQSATAGERRRPKTVETTDKSAETRRRAGMRQAVADEQSRPVVGKGTARR